MKSLIKIFSLIIFVLCVIACEKDNYDPPKSQLSGKIMYNETSIGLKGTGESVQLQLYQDGWQKRDPIAVFAKQDGTFEALLFNGTYKLITRNSNGPWINKQDTVVVEVKGNTQCEIEVTPYFTISDPQIKMENNIVKGKLTVHKIVENAKIGKVTLLLNKTQFVDETVKIAEKNITNGQPGSYEIDLDVSDNKEVNSAHAIYARVGVKAAGADQAIYSQVIRLR